MIIIPRPLSYSLAIHLIILAVLIFSISHDSTRESRTSLKLQMISLSSSPAVFSKPTAPQPKTQAEPIPIQKATPIAPAALPVNKTIPMVPTPPIVTKPALPAMSVPTITPTEAPKVAHLPAPHPQVQVQAQSVNVEKEFLDAHLGEIRTLLIQNLRYPRNAQRLKMQGEVRVSFRLKSDGSVENIEVIQSSGFELLDEDAKALIKNTAPQFPKPTKSISLSVPLSYLLR